MRSFLGIAGAAGVVALVACGGSTFTSSSDAGTDGHSSSSGSSGGGSSGGGSGGSTSSSGGGSGGSSSGSGGSGSSSGTMRSPCPPSAPQTGQPCAPDGAQCEYGTDPDPNCNEIVECMSGTWAGGGTGAKCPVGMCPLRYVDVPKGQACPESGVDCAYKEGQCNCSFTSPSGTMNTPTWHCFSPPGCPEPRPDVGTPCTQDGLSCDYGACTGGLAETCTSGYWQWAMTACPG